MSGFVHAHSLQSGEPHFVGLLVWEIQFNFFFLLFDFLGLDQLDSKSLWNNGHFPFTILEHGGPSFVRHGVSFVVILRETPLC